MTTAKLPLPAPAAATNSTSAAQPREGQNQRAPLTLKAAFFILLALNLARLAFGLCFDLAPQEAYYFLYAQHPALSYFDHPPLMAWSLWLFTSIFGAHPFVLRLTAFTLTLLTQFGFFGLARRFLPSSRQAHALLLFATTAMISVVSLISLPDVPLLLFWTLSLLCLERAIFGGRQVFWLLAGLCMGLCFDGKYTGVFLQIGLALFLVLSRPHRRWLKTPWPYLCILLAHVAMLPVYVWNARNGFASFLFQSADRASTWSGLHPINFLKLLGSQTALLLPPLLIGVVTVFFRSLKRLVTTRAHKPCQQKPLFLLCFFAPLFLGFTALSFVTLVKPNWLMPAWITGILFAALLLPRRLTAWNLAFALVLHIAIAVEVASRTGRATYLFRIAARARYASLPFDELAALARTRVIEVARDLVALGFRRSPIHLSDEAIRQPRHQTLRLALRHVPALSALRSAFIGRVIHGPGWRERVEALLAAD